MTAKPAYNKIKAQYFKEIVSRDKSLIHNIENLMYVNCSRYGCMQM